MASSNLGPQGIKYLKEIQDLLNQKDYDNMIKKIIDFTRFLFSGIDVIYSELNDEFERSNLMMNLFDCMNVLNEQYQRDILRLLNLFLKTNKDLRSKATFNEKCLQFLLNKLSNINTWRNLDKIKYYANLSSYLLLIKETQVDTEEIRQIVKQFLDKMNDDDDVLLKKINLMMLHSAIEMNARFNPIEDRFQQNNIPHLTKNVIGTFEEWIRDYLYDFKVFYENPDTNKSRFDKYNLKIEYGFDQICQCILYYTNTPEVRMDVYQSGLYSLFDLILKINSVPEHFMLNAIEILEIPCLDPVLKERFRVEHSTIINRLKTVQLKSSSKLKEIIENLLKKYDCIQSLPSTECENNSFSNTKNLITLSNSTQKSLPIEIANWGKIDVDQWLLESNLESCCQPLSSLTGRGLNQLKTLMKENDGKFKLIDLLMLKLNLDLVAIFELFGALESLDSD